MRPFLEQRGIEVIETDLGERIQQLDDEPPSHIVVPAVHKLRTDVAEVFARTLGTDPNNSDVHYLAESQRRTTRPSFLSADAGMTGANFAIAETGAVVVCTNEGNADLSVHLPRLYIASIGIEKVIPSWEDLAPMLQLLPRSSTGERMNPYTTMWTGVHDGDGASEVHVILLDNGRSHVLGDRHGRQALRCIRCSACLNVCPVYERTGGHAYGSVYPGPIGAVLNPQLRGTASDIDKSLPFASSLCGACFDACPVRINIPEMLVDLRAQVADEGGRTAESAAMRATAWLFSDPRRLTAAQKAATLAGRLLGDRTIRSVPGLGAWTNARDIPTPPKETFRAWWARERGSGSGKGSTR